MIRHHDWESWLQFAADESDMAMMQCTSDRVKALNAFVRESNGIEGIHRTPSRKEVGAHVGLLSKPEIGVADLCAFVAGVQPYARLRDVVGINVRVGNHIAPPGGPEIRDELTHLLEKALSPYDKHLAYLTLHPFSDGNERSSRALWLYQRGPRSLGLPFLQRFYYDTLDRADGRSPL